MLIDDVAVETPLTLAHNLTNKLGGTRILLKREDMQPVFSFKLRGANNRMQQLTLAEREKGVIACSAGNHAQGQSIQWIEYLLADDLFPHQLASNFGI